MRSLCPRTPGSGQHHGLHMDGLGPFRARENQGLNTEGGGVSAGELRVATRAAPGPNRGRTRCLRRLPSVRVPLTVEGVVSTHGSRHSASPGQDVIRTGSGAVSSSTPQVPRQEEPKEQALAPRDLRGAASVALKAVTTGASGHRHLHCLNPTQGTQAPAGKSAGRASCSPALGTTHDLYQKGFLKAGEGQVGESLRAASPSKLLREASSVTGTDHLIENRQRCVSFNQRNISAVFSDSSKIFPIRT